MKRILVAFMMALVLIVGVVGVASASQGGVWINRIGVASQPGVWVD